MGFEPGIFAIEVGCASSEPPYINIYCYATPGLGKNHPRQSHTAKKVAQGEVGRILKHDSIAQRK